jgi:AcrR family transcriptional regulator
MPLASKTRRRTRRAQPRRTTLRDVIRNTARELFAREGYESVSMRRIAAEIGCSPMAMYRHYASKEDLLISICEETFGGMLRLLDARREQPGTPLEKLRKCMRLIMDFHLSHPNHYKVTFMTAVPPGPTADRKAAIAQRAMDRLRAAVRECAEAKGLDIDIELAAHLLRTGVFGVVSTLIMAPKSCQYLDPERFKQEMIVTLSKQFE